MEKLKAKLTEICSLDLRSLAFFRVLLGTLTLLDIIQRFEDITAHYTDRGVLPRDAYIEKFWTSTHWSIHMASGDVIFQALLFVLAGLFAIGLILGYRTRFCTIAGWILLISVQNRNYMVLNGGDVLFRMLHFWSMFLPLGARFSIDHALTKRTGNPEEENNRYTGMAPLALMIQISCLYVFTALLKTGKEWTETYTATYFALQIDQFTTPFGNWFRQFEGILKISTFAVLWWELLGTLLFYSPIAIGWCRIVAILGYCAMHAGFFSMMHIGLFPIIDMVAVLALTPGFVWDWLGKKLATPTRGDLRIYYDGACGFCFKMVRMLAEFTFIPASQILKAQDDSTADKLLRTENSWSVRSATGTYATRWGALVLVLQTFPFVGRFLGTLNRLQAIGDTVYKVIAARRNKLGEWSAAWLPERTFKPVRPRLIPELLCAIFCWYVITWNIQSLDENKLHIKIPFTQTVLLSVPVDIEIKWPFSNVAGYLRLDQKWSMFAPFPLKDDGWYVMPGKLENGIEVDVFKFREEKASWDKPELVSEWFPNERWRKYLMNMWRKDYNGHRLYFGRWLCRSWNSGSYLSNWTDGRKGANRLHTFTINFMEETTELTGPVEPKKVEIWKHECYTKTDTSEISH